MDQKDINIELRSKILEYALNLESSVNSLLLVQLSIFDTEKTKNFGNKAGLTFKNKIDLLFDLQVLSQEEANSLELLMVIRNKFLHDINCNSFTYLLNSLDNGIFNRFKKHLPENLTENDEDNYEKSCFNLYKHNVNLLIEKFNKRKNEIELRVLALTELTNLHILLVNKSLDTMQKISFLLVNELLQNPQYSDLSMKITKICDEFVNDSDLKQQTIKFSDLTTQELIIGLLK